MATTTDTQPSLLTLLESEIEAENIELRSDVRRLWSALRAHGMSDSQIQVSTGVQLPQVWEVL